MDFSSAAGIITMLIVLGVAFVIFLCIREILLWYYKINERVALQYETNRLLRKIAGEPPLKPKDGGALYVCQQCGHKDGVPFDYCPSCGKNKDGKILQL